MAYTYSTLFIIGAVLGSFYNVVGTRLPLKQSLIAPRSSCTSCHHQLFARELIPIISYVLLRGKCSQCKNKIGVFHLAIECSTAVLFCFAFWRFGYSIEILVSLLFISMLAIITVSDIQYMVIQNRILLLFGVLILFLRFTIQQTPILELVGGAILGFGLLFALSILSKGGIGGGDIKMYVVIGLVLGIQNTFISLFLASVIGLFIAFLLKKGMRELIPFGPAIAIGSLVAYFFGDELSSSYMQMMNFLLEIAS